MLGFEKSYPDVRRVLLDVNYRSPREIVETSLRLISHNTQRFDKKIYANEESVNQKLKRKAEKQKIRPSNHVHYNLWESQQQEGKNIIEQILQSCRKGYTYNDCAVLFRTNTQPRLFMSQLMAYNIPFRTRDNIPNLYEHWITRDILTYIRLAQGSRTRKDMLKIMIFGIFLQKRLVTYSHTDIIDGCKWPYAAYDPQIRFQLLNALRHPVLFFLIKIICPAAPRNFPPMRHGFPTWRSIPRNCKIRKSSRSY